VKRRRLTPTQKAGIIARQVNCCGCGCGGDLEGQAVEFDHMLPLALGGADTPENMQALLPDHHRIKTRDDVRRIRKADRQRRYHETGKSHQHRTRPIQSRGFDTTFKRKMNGEVVRAD
jgi:5-methylcytosine-specific restriction protein A